MEKDYYLATCKVVDKNRKEYLIPVGGTWVETNGAKNAAREKAIKLYGVKEISDIVLLEKTDMTKEEFKKRTGHDILPWEGPFPSEK